MKSFIPFHFVSRFALFLVLAGCHSALNARSIQGVVMSANDSTAVIGANCRLLSSGKILTGTVTDAAGAFSLQTDEKASLALEISMTGFSSTDVIIESGARNLNIGTVWLNEGVSLNQVEVTGNSVVHSGGRTIVYPSAADVRASSTAIGLFMKLPLAGLEADPINRTISVDGGTPVILINGVPSTLSDLHALQPKDIEKIEFSRFTPARYADSGNSGLLSIILKKRDDGGQVYLWGHSAVNTAFVDANLSTSYHQGASQFTLQYSPSWRNYQDVYDSTDRSYIGSDFRVNLHEQDRNPFNYHYHPVKVRYDYSPDIKTLFSATLNLNRNSHDSREITSTSDSELGEYDNRNFTKDRSFTPSLDLFMRRDFNDKNSLEAQVVGTLNSGQYRRDNNYIFADGDEEAYIMNADTRRRSLITAVSYIHKFSDRTTLSAGYQNTLSRSTNTYLSSDYKPVLTENNNYAYVSFGQSAGKFYFNVSTGAKLFWINNDVNRRHFIKNLSSARADWYINDNWNLRAFFNYSPYIPSLTTLTDYPQQTTPYLISNGNPDLNVSDNYSYSLMASFTKKKFQAALQTSFYDTDKSMVGEVRYLGNGLFLSQTVNSRYTRLFQNTLNFRISDIYGFGARLNLTLGHYSTAGADWSHKLTSLSGSITVWWNHGPYTISYWRKLPGKYLSGHYVGKNENGDSLAFEWKPDRHWTVGASWMYMFDKKGTRYPGRNYSAVSPMQRDRYIKNNSNMVVLSLSYSADFGSIFRTARRNLNNTDSGSSLLQM